MKVFISHPFSPAGKKLVSDVAEKVKGSGITVQTSGELQQASPSQSWSQLASDLSSCDKFVVVIENAEPKTKAQDFEWRSCLEATWSDPSKLLIPVLIGDVKLPNFVRSAIPAGKAVEAIRIENPSRDWNQVADKLAMVLKEQTDFSTIAQNLSSTEEDRARQRERLAYLKSTAEVFKPKTM